MNKCEDIRARLILYLDDELRGSEDSALEAHLQACEACRGLFESEQGFIGMLRQSRPLQTAPDELRDRVRELLADAPDPPVASAQLRERVRRALRAAGVDRRPLLSWRATIAAGIVLLILPVAWYWIHQGLVRIDTRVNAPSEFALMAASTHLRHTRGQLPLEISSDSPGEISNWFDTKVPFRVKLPNYQESSGQEKLYQLEGGRLVGYKKDYAAYVAYQMNAHPISLVITSDNQAQPTGGEEIKAKGLTFHYDTIDGLKIITWSDRGLTYALVSDLEERGQQSCVVCHEGTKDQDFIAPLKPR